MALLEIRNGCKKFSDKVVLDNVNLVVNEKDIFGILGLSGAGKSTLVRCINGLEKFDSGEVFYENELVVLNKEYRRNVSMIFQSFNLLEQKNVLQNVVLAGKLGKDPHAKEHAIELLKEVGMSDKLSCYPSTLSGGEKQRVAIARALMTNPKILLCDEATSALDPDTTIAILELLKKLNETHNLTIIIISHQMNVIDNICNKVAIIDKAKIIEEGNLYDVFLSPKTEIAKKLIYSRSTSKLIGDSIFIKLLFNGDVDKPILSNIILELHIELSIVYADTKVIDNKQYGQMVLKLSNYENDIVKLKKYLEINQISYEEVNGNGL